jgi:16S rRNA (guanine(1405)-N(7))-methyltransferase
MCLLSSSSWEKECSRWEMEKIIDDIKKKKEFSGLNNNLVVDRLNETLRQNPKLNEFLVRDRSEGYKKIVKLTREKLHKAYGVFQENKSQVQKLLDELQSTENEHEIFSIHRMLLSSVLSTKERLEFYEEMYKGIFELTGWPRSILDLGCGFNPMSFPFMGVDEVDYYAYDINEEDVEILNRYFGIMGDDISGKARLFKFGDSTQFPKADVCFLFKVLDILDAKGHKKSEELIESLDCKWIVASFSTKTVSGRPMEHAHRGWMDQMLKRRGHEFKILEFENEIFYVIKK